MTNDKATPRPWYLMDDEENKGKHPYHDGRFLVADNENNPSGVDVIAKFTDGSMADRDLTVRAVNNFDSLLEACKLSLEHLKPEQEKTGSDYLRIMVEAIEQAINKATEGR